MEELLLFNQVPCLVIVKSLSSKGGSYLQYLLQLSKLTLELPVVLLQEAHPTLQPRPVLPQHGGLGQHLGLCGVHRAEPGPQGAQGHVRGVEGHPRHLTAHDLQVVVLLLEVGVLLLQLLYHELELFPLLGVNLERDLHRAVGDEVAQLAVHQLLAVHGDQGVLIFPAMNCEFLQ